MPGAHPTRVAAIDAGSNAVRLMVADVGPGGAFKVVAEEREPTQLAKGLRPGGRLSSDAIEASAQAIAQFVQRAQSLNAKAIRAVATAAVRDAINGHELVNLVLREHGVRLEVISPQQEGGLAYLSLARRFEISDLPAAALDIGGGSAQLVFAAHAMPIRAVSVPLGAVMLTTEFGGWTAMATKQFPRFRHHVDRLIAQALKAAPVKPAVLVGTGGTVTAVASLAHPARPGKKQDSSVDHTSLKQLIQTFRSAAPTLPPIAANLPADRAEILFAGLVVLERMADLMGIDTVHAHAGGIREGICWSLAEGLGTPPVPAMDGVRAFALRCRYERDHSEHVTRLCTSIFGQLKKTPAVKRARKHEPRALELLQAAAVLHDIGTVVDFERHHKHSRDMILCAELPGFDQRESVILANLARYHRRTGPRKSHNLFASLNNRDQDLVRTLTAILRLADGLDRSHTQTVARAKVTIGRKAAEIVVTAATPAKAEIRAAKAKGDVFTQVFGVTLNVAAPKAKPL